MKKLILLITLGLIVSFTSNVKAQTCKAAIDYIFSDTTNTYTLLNTGSSGKGYSFYWDFGDGKSSTSRFVTHTYAKKGLTELFYMFTLVVRVLVSDSCDCNYKSRW